MQVTVLDQRFRMALVGLTVLFGLVRVILPEENLWIHSIFIILMAGNVGYFTNFLAIKMLFQPKQGRVLGWEGLVPKNKPEIARSLAESVQTQLLAPEIILEYIHEKQLIEKATQRLGDWADRVLGEQKSRDQITERLIALLRAHGDEALEMLFDQSEQMLKELAADPARVRELWLALRSRLADFLADRQNRAHLTEMVRHVLEEEVPRLSEMLDNAMEQHLRSRESLGGAVGIGLKRFFSVDRDAIREALERFVREEESGQQLVDVLDSVVEVLLEELGTEETQSLVVSKVEAWVNGVAEFAREHLLPLGAERLQRWLDDEQSWAQIDSLVLRGIQAGRQAAEEMLGSEQGQEAVKRWLGNAVRRINVSDLVEEQVMKLDTDELEDLILNNTGGNLVVIQILGGTLGMVAGFVQVDIRFAIPLLALMGVVYVAFQHNQRKFSR